MSQVDVIAIDGPVASGKGSVSSGVAKALDFHVLDSGALYRLTALACMNQCVDLSDAAAAEKVAQSLNPLFKGRKNLSGRQRGYRCNPYGRSRIECKQNCCLSRRQKSFI